MSENQILLWEKCNMSGKIIGILEHLFWQIHCLILSRSEADVTSRHQPPHVHKAKVRDPCYFSTTKKQQRKLEGTQRKKKKKKENASCRAETFNKC